MSNYCNTNGFNKKIRADKEGTLVDKGRYQRLVGRLIYLSHIRPDIGFSVSVASQFINNPIEIHMEAIYRILKYLKMTTRKGLLYKKSGNNKVELFMDADWTGSIFNKRSTTGYCTYVWWNLVTWRSKKQLVVTHNNAETEFKALALGICEGMWLKRLLNELGVLLRRLIQLLCDNQTAISIAKNLDHRD